MRRKPAMIMLLVQILVLGLLLANSSGCDLSLRTDDSQVSDNRTLQVPQAPGAPSCSGPAACGPPEYPPTIVPPGIAQPPPASKGSPPTPPELVDGEKLPSGTRETGGTGGGSGGGGGGGGRGR